MKKIISTILIFIILLINFSSIILADGDTLAPYLTDGVSKNIETLRPNENITFTIPVEDDFIPDVEIASGVDTIWIEWILEGNEQITYSKSFQYSNTNTYIYTVPGNAPAGNYITRTLGMVDAAGNNRIYSLAGLENEEDIEWVRGIISSLDFVVEEVEQDTTGPVISNFVIQDYNFNDGGMVNFTYSVEDPSGVNYGGGISYSPVNNPSQVNFASGTQQGQNTYKATIYISNKYTKYKINGVQATDTLGNTSNYTTAQLGLAENVYVSANNYAEDNIAPIITKVEFDKTKVNLPGQLEINVEVTESGSGIGFAYNQAHFTSEDGQFDKTALLSFNGNDKCIGSLELGEDVTYRGNIYCDEIVVTDFANNKAVYSIANGKLTKTNIEIVKKEINYTLKTSTADNNYIQNISNLPSGSTVLCNVSKTNQVIRKEVFDTIKGKDIEITFMNIYSGLSSMVSSGQISSDESNMGIQWIINGKDITNETKDINMVVTLKQNTYNKLFVKGHELDAEELMKKEQEIMEKSETEEEWYNNKKAWLIEEVNKYFDELKEDGYIVEEYRERALELMDDENMVLMGSVSDFIAESEPNQFNYIAIQFADNGVLPCKTKVRLKLEYAARSLIGSKGLKLYYANGENYTLEQDSISIDEDDYYNFTLTHNSEFWLLNGEVEKLAKTTTETKYETNAEIDKTSSNPTTGDNIVLWISLTVISMLGIVGTVKYLKKK